LPNILPILNPGPVGHTPNPIWHGVCVSGWGQYPVLLCPSCPPQCHLAQALSSELDQPHSLHPPCHSIRSVVLLSIIPLTLPSDRWFTLQLLWLNLMVDSFARLTTWDGETPLNASEHPALSPEVSEKPSEHLSELSNPSFLNSLSTQWFLVCYRV
jgi:hypothetical protein